MSRFFLWALLISGLSTGSVFASERDANALQLASVSAAVARLGSDEPEFSKRGDWVMPIASITKLMTALVVLESEQDLDAWLPVVKRARPAPVNAFSRIRLESEATRRDLLHLALMSSENRAAYLLARHHPEGYEAFIEAMNAKARALGMNNTHFVDSTGLSDANVSTASDLVKLANAAYEYPLIRELSTSSGRWVQFRGPRYGLQFGNTNPLVRSGRWDVSLSKTGYLNASGRCLVMIAEMGGEPHVVVLLDSLGTRTPLGDSGRIRRWLETGVGGNVAAAALNYERQRASEIAAELEVASPQSAGL
ncbi:D-alanyl-D-alanine endopeptidase [Marinimicrobium sp. ABcell2]|uniref:D-alanyl-D-alanine endopeptidase n=1 Tax=Marinimicrobium sp. ABcell2 TaxID=3069751 RepID=UPI0027B6780B|nr:D-alanyl-D-alanine endopeptidase [Marinimicrobium sp. ABcell2]MDQ2076073.1 D-alanyl-D-alanine endopeptidase [Marinimicrobium sp. ABcell2]